MGVLGQKEIWVFLLKMKGEEPTLQMNMASFDTAVKTEYFTMRFFHILGLCESCSHSRKQALQLLLFQLDGEMTETQTS